MYKILLIIPAYNEGDNIVSVMEELFHKCTEFDYLIINDGSKDNTEAICKERNYHCMNLPVNVGLGGVFQIGMKYADRKGYEMALQYDGDGQHSPNYIAQMITVMKEKNADIVIGSRYLNGLSCFTLRTIGSKFIKCLIYITTGKKITDPTSGMRLYNKRMIHLLGNNINMPPEPDSLAYITKCGYKIEEVAVQMRERQAGKSYLNWGNSIRYMVNMCISIIFIQWFRKRDL